MKNSIIPKLINESDGTVSRVHYCDCGKSLYKKNLTTGKMFFVVRIIEGIHESHILEPLNNPAVFKLTCRQCNTEHLVGDIKESMCISPV